MNCGWLLAHHYQRKSIPEKKNLKRKKGENQKHPIPFFFMGNCTVGAKQLTHQIKINKGHDQKNSAYNEYEGKYFSCKESSTPYPPMKEAYAEKSNRNPVFQN